MIICSHGVSSIQADLGWTLRDVSVWSAPDRFMLLTNDERMLYWY